MKRAPFVVLFAAGLAVAAPLAPRAFHQAAPVTEAAPCAKVWVGHESEYEEFLRTAPVDRIQDVPVGVTKPKRAYFKPGGLAASAVWKPLKPGMHGGYQDSYKAEIAAYELDKLLGLHMVPPYVERTFNNAAGAVGYWVENTKVWKISEPVTGPDPEAWARQIITQKLFDLLIGNADRNQGNLLYDPEFHLVLIDHSRAFTSDTDISKMPKPTRIVRSVWEKMAGLTEADLQGAIGRWVSSKELRAVLQRRDRIAEEIQRMVKQRTERAVFLP